MGFFEKLISGSNLRKTRLHDEKGNFVGWKNVLMHAPPAILSGLLRISVGYRPKLPWIGYSSISMLSSFLNKNSRVLEFGSGMSTIWYSKYAKEVYSIEDFRPWYDKISLIISTSRIQNIHYRFAESELDFISFMSEDSQGFDLVMVDGTCRDKCASHALKLVRPGGILYLDDSDKDSNPEVGNGEIRLAESLIKEFAYQRNAQLIQLTDFSPTQFFVKQGTWIKLPGQHRSTHT